MPAVYLIGYGGGFPPPEAHELCPGPKNEKELVERVMRDTGLEDNGGDPYLLSPAEEPEAAEIAELIGAGLNLRTIEFEPVHRDVGSDDVLHNLGLAVKRSLEIEEMDVSDASQLLIVAPKIAIAEEADIETGEVIVGAAYFSNRMTMQQEGLNGAIRERELLHG